MSEPCSAPERRQARQISWPLSTGLFRHRQGASSPCQQPAAAKPLVARRQSRRPPAVPAGARAHQGRAARLVRGPGLHRGRDQRPAGVARQRDAPAAFATELIGPTARAGRSICTPRPSSPARSCWRPARRRSSPSPRASAIASAARLHHPAFTMLEWYRADEPYERLMEDCAELLRIAAEAAGTTHAALRRPQSPIRSRRPSASRSPTPSTATPASTCWRTLDGRGACQRHALAAAASAAGIRVRRRRHLGRLFSRVLVEKIEPQLGNGRATCSTEYPGRARRAGAAASRPTRASPSASSSTPAAWSSPTPSAS